MFLKITRMTYFDTLNSNMTIAKKYKKSFSRYNFFFIYKNIGKYCGHHRCF